MTCIPSKVEGICTPLKYVTDDMKLGYIPSYTYLLISSMTIQQNRYHSLEERHMFTSFLEHNTNQICQKHIATLGLLRNGNEGLAGLQSGKN